MSPGNITVDETSKCFIILVDWETSGFYPSWFLVVDLMTCYPHDFCELRLDLLRRKAEDPEAGLGAGNAVPRSSFVRYTGLWIPARRGESSEEGQAGA